MNLKDVLGKKIVICCSSEEECSRVLGILAKNNIRWAAGQLATELNYYGKHGKSICYSFSEGRITNLSISDARDRSLQVVESINFNEFSILDIRNKDNGTKNR
jgi:hypothetical protein